MQAQNLYACSRLPLHLSSYVDTMRFNLPYASLFGGVVAIAQDTFEAVNGFSNEFSGKFSPSMISLDDSLFDLSLEKDGVGKMTTFGSTDSLHTQTIE